MIHYFSGAEAKVGDLVSLAPSAIRAKTRPAGSRGVIREILEKDRILLIDWAQKMDPPDDDDINVHQLILVQRAVEKEG